MCGCLELGRDGVGDYSRRLAGELVLRGHEVLVIALDDRHLNHELEDRQATEGAFVNTLRLPATWSSRQRMLHAQASIRAFDPDWLSLQFVPYSFHPKGLPAGIPHQLARLGGGRSWHVMFHELWLDDLDRPQHHIIALLQRWIVRQLLVRLRPLVIDVSNRHNERRLRAAGFHARTIAMVGNIPLIRNETVPEGFLPIADCAHRLLYFGSPPVGKAADRIVEDLVDYSKAYPSQVGIAVVGGEHEARTDFAHRLEEALSSYGSQIVDLGFLEAEHLSALMQRCSAGIVRNGAHFIGKSGTAMAMLEHGLPIWLPLWSDGETLECEFRSELVFSNLDEACHASHPEPQSLLASTATSFLRALEKASRS